MKFIIQRVKNAKVSVSGAATGQIEKGFLVLVGIGQGDTKELADKLVKKMCSLRIFEDENDKTNLDINAVGGKLLLVSQFTLYADCKKGNRPSFTNAAGPAQAEELYNYICEQAENYVPGVQRGVFGAHMEIELLNDGPFTVILDSRDL